MIKNYWPEIDYKSFIQTKIALHMWIQIIGKFRLANTNWLNHSWHATLYVSSKGLTTGLVHACDSAIEINFNFINHKLELNKITGEQKEFSLTDLNVSEFYSMFVQNLEELGFDPSFHNRPNEVEESIAFQRQTEPVVYNSDSVKSFWLALVKIEKVFQIFRSAYIGKVSPVHLFWGSFDLAVTRFSGNDAPLHAGGLPNLPLNVAQEAYSHEVSSAGFWSGEQVGEPAFYSYAYPGFDGFEKQPTKPEGAYFHKDLGEYILTYDKVRASNNPEEDLLNFLFSTYEAAAKSKNWDKEKLECPIGKFCIPREF